MMTRVRRACARTILAIALAFPAMPFLASSPVAAFDDGTAYNGPHIVPGVVEAEDFNDGGLYVGYGAYTADGFDGNQGNYNGRGNTGIDLFDDGAQIYIRSVPRTDNSGNLLEAREWAKYTLQVQNDGWYKLSYVAKNDYDRPVNLGLITVIDNRQYRGVEVPTQPGFATLDVDQPIYLTSGEHVLKVVFSAGFTCLDKIVLSPITDPNFTLLDDVGFPGPRIADAPLTTDEVVVADAVATDSPFHADNTGLIDSTSAIQAALDAVADMGGGTVFLPAGMYRVDGQLKVHQNTTLRGDWASPLNGGSGQGTILKVYYGHGDEDLAKEKAFIHVTEPNVSIRNISFWYPNQGVGGDTVPYPYTIATTKITSYFPSIVNVTFYNSYKGIYMIGSSGSYLANLYMTALKDGIKLGAGAETPYFYNVFIENGFWKNAPESVISNAPTSNAERIALDAYTQEHLMGIQLGQSDGEQIYNVSVKDANRDIVLEKLPEETMDFYGVMSKIDAEIEAVELRDFVHYVNTDTIPETAGMSYTFAAPRKPANSGNFYNVKAAPYSATGDGVADDAAAIQDALDDAGAAGGGTVYLPPGVYKVSTHLSVPQGVELRGAYGVLHGAEGIDATLVLAFEGKGASNPQTDTAFITLAADSGVRGFTIAYPDQGFGDTIKTVSPYPYTIRGAGSGVWIADMNLLNSYYGVDLATHRTDGHLVSGVWGTAFKLGMDIGGEAVGGVIERAFISFAMVYQSYKDSSPMIYGLQPLIDYVKTNTVGFRYGDSSGERSYSSVAFYVNVAHHFVDDGNGGPTDAEFWHAGSDWSRDYGYLFEGGDDLRFIGLVGGSSYEGAGTWLRTTSGFGGTVDVYGRLNWAIREPESVSGGTVNFYDDRSLTYGKPAIASEYLHPYELPSHAVDGRADTKWTANPIPANQSRWLRVDLQQPMEITSWSLKNAGIHEPEAYNTHTFQLQTSDDGVNFSVADGIEGNTADIFSREIGPVTARYLRLAVYAGTNPASDGYVRIPELMAFGRAGWHFTQAADGWSAGSQLVGLAASNGRLVMTSTGTDPILLSPDQLGINLFKHKKVKIRMKNGTSSTTGQLFFETDAEQGFTEDKSVLASITANDPLWTEYTFDFSEHEKWNGTLKRLRFDPSASTGEISIDEIVFVSGDEGWTFDGGAQGWAAGSQIVNLTASGGYLDFASTGSDPFLVSPDGLNIPAGDYRKVKIRWKNSTSSTTGQLFFSTTSDPTFTEAKSAAISIQANDTGYTEYTFDFTGNPDWTGTLKQFRFDPATDTGTISVDSIVLTH